MVCAFVTENALKSLYDISLSRRMNGNKYASGACEKCGVSDVPAKLLYKAHVDIHTYIHSYKFYLSCKAHTYVQPYIHICIYTIHQYNGLNVLVKTFLHYFSAIFVRLRVHEKGLQSGLALMFLLFALNCR